jgi:hypothetical protein
LRSLHHKIDFARVSSLSRFAESQKVAVGASNYRGDPKHIVTIATVLKDDICLNGRHRTTLKDEQQP